MELHEFPEELAWLQQPILASVSYYDEAGKTHDKIMWVAGVFGKEYLAIYTPGKWYRTFIPLSSVELFFSLQAGCGVPPSPMKAEATNTVI